MKGENCDGWIKVLEFLQNYLEQKNINPFGKLIFKKFFSNFFYFKEGNIQKFKSFDLVDFSPKKFSFEFNPKELKKYSTASNTELASETSIQN